MSSEPIVRLTPGRRLGRGLKYSAVGPVDVARGALGVSVDSVRSSAAWVGNRYRRGQIGRQLEADLASAQDVVANLPEALGKARRSGGRRRPLLFASVGVAVLAGGALAFSIVRRSSQPEPEPSPLPPSVDVAPKP